MTVRKDNFPVIMRPNYDLIRENARKHSGVELDAVEAVLEFVRVGSLFFAEADSFFASVGLSRARFTVLVSLAQRPEGLSPAQLADEMRVSRATMTGLIDTLEKAGHVERHDDPTDRRMFTIVITAAGMDFLEQILPTNFRRMTIIMSRLSNKDRAELIRLMKKVEGGVEEVRTNGPTAPKRKP